MIGAVLLRYNGEAALLESAVRSIINSEFSSAEQVSDIVIVDNASTVDPDAVDRVAALFPQTNIAGNRIVRAIRQPTNGGFATGVNRGIAALHSDCDLVVLLNDDARFGATALAQLTATLRNAPAEVISVGPKMYLDQENGLLESVGMAVSNRGEAKNVGLGQLDLGQFDGDTESFGPSFGAALIRRSAFLSNNIGPLREEFFMYYEDVEWNWRAHRLGFRSLVVPNAHGWHRMSSSSRGEGHPGSLAASESAYNFKHRCIERNLLVTGATHLPASDAIRLWAYRWPRLIKGIVTGRFPRASFWAAIDGVRRLPRSLRQRRAINRHAPAPQNPFRFWPPEPIYFDPVTYQPQRSWTALQSAARLARLADLAQACETNDLDAALRAASRLPQPYEMRVSEYVSQLT